MDLKPLINHLDVAHAITYLNRVVILFDSIVDKFDIFKVAIDSDASYMIVAGIHDPSNIVRVNNKSQIV